MTLSPTPQHQSGVFLFFIGLAVACRQTGVLKPTKERGVKKNDLRARI